MVKESPEQVGSVIVGGCVGTVGGCVVGLPVGFAVVGASVVGADSAAVGDLVNIDIDIDMDQLKSTGVAFSRERVEPSEDLTRRRRRFVSCPLETIVESCAPIGSAMAAAIKMGI